MFIWDRTYGFGWGSNPERGAFEGLGPEIETFLGPEMAKSVASAIWAQKSPEVDSPHPNPYVQPHINNKYIGNFMDKRQERDKRFKGLFRRVLRQNVASHNVYVTKRNITKRKSF